MNSEQFQSLVRLMLGAGGPLSAWLISRYGVSQAGVDAFSGALIAAVGAVPVLGSFLWGLRRHSTVGQIEATAAIPEVKKVIVTPTPGTGAAIAAADPAQPKVTVS